MNQYAVYQLKELPEIRNYQFLPYKEVKNQGISVQSGNYEQVYISLGVPGDSIDKIWDGLKRNKPKRFKGHSIGTSDVIAHNIDGITSAYYVDGEKLIPIAGFFRINSSGTLITMDTRDYQMEGVEGNWIATDEIIVDGKQFFLMQNEKFGTDAAFAVVSADGKLVADDCYHGFDETMIQRIKDFLHPPMQQQRPAEQQKKLETYQKYYENGEYLRSAEISEEQNYNMIDGIANNRDSNKKAKNPKERESVLAKLHQKQKAIAAKNGKEQVQENQMERNRK